MVVVDGSFLQSPVLAGAWDEVIWLQVSFDVALGRALVRDAERFGGVEEVRGAYASRYHAACRLYLADLDPRSTASIVVDNEELDVSSGVDQLHRRP